MERTRCIAIAFATVAAMASASLAVVAPGDECGDINGDGNVSTVDALIILNGSVGVDVDLLCSTGADGCGDVNGDGNMSPTDALLVLNHSVGIPVEFSCPGGAAVRNRVRYLNSLVCNDKVFTSVLTLTAEDLTWQSRSGTASAYQDYDKEQLGGGWEVTLGACGTRDFTDLVEPDPGMLVRVELTLGLIGNLDLKFFHEGPIPLTAGDEPFAVLSVPAPAGLSAAR